MTPSRPNPPTAGSNSWVEPPPGVQPPAAAASTAIGPSAIGPSAAAAAAVKPDQQTASSAGQRPVRRARVVRRSGDSMAARLNRQELNSIRSGGGGYYRRYWSWAGY